jgi:hypothetical protein
MTRGLAVGALVAGALVLFVSLRDRSPEPAAPPSASNGLPHFTGAPNREAETPPEPLSPAVVEEQVRQVMQRWRTSILNRNAEGVLDCDRTFYERPVEFGAALRASAESDDDERVRAFSTRMLGKLRDRASADLFAKLLKDPSVAVRGNAAWGLGRLGDARAPGPSPAASSQAGAQPSRQPTARRQGHKSGQK